MQFLRPTAVQQQQVAQAGVRDAVTVNESGNVVINGNLDVTGAVAMKSSARVNALARPNKTGGIVVADTSGSLRTTGKSSMQTSHVRWNNLVVNQGCMLLFSGKSAEGLKKISFIVHYTPNESFVPMAAANCTVTGTSKSTLRVKVRGRNYDLDFKVKDGIASASVQSSTTRHWIQGTFMTLASGDSPF